MIVANPGPSSKPLIRVTAPASTRQTRIGFSASLVRQANLTAIKHVAIDFDEVTRSLTFIPTKTATHNGKPAFPLIKDGGQQNRNGHGRAVYIHRQLLPIPVGSYEPQLHRNRSGCRLTIQLKPVAQRFKSPSDFGPRLGGVYRIQDSAGVDLDIGCSKTDVRRRVLTKWKNEQPEAFSILFYALNSEEECLHLERELQREFFDAQDRLPKYCAVLGKGCGCSGCKRSDR